MTTNPRTPIRKLKRSEETSGEVELIKVTVQVPRKAHAQMHQLLGLRMEFDSAEVVIGQLYREAVDRYLQVELPKFKQIATDQTSDPHRPA